MFNKPIPEIIAENGIQITYTNTHKWLPGREGNHWHFRGILIAILFPLCSSPTDESRSCSAYYGWPGLEVNLGKVDSVVRTEAATKI